MTLYLLALLIGVVAGLRAMTAPAAIAWAAFHGWIDLAGTPLAWLGYHLTPWFFTAFALAELVTDQLPTTPSRKVPVQFGARLVLGGLSGAAIGTSGGASGGLLIGGAIAGVIGAVIGTLGGAAGRAKLAKGFASDRPAAIIEDGIAIGGAFLIVSALT